MGESVAVGTTPMPVSETDCGLLGALSVIVTTAFLAPAAVGVKVTVIVQLPPAATDGTQLLVWPKSLLFAPVISIEIVRAMFPVFESVTF